MMPQTRHNVERGLIYENYKIYFKDFDEFTRICDVNCCDSIGAEFFSKKWFVPGALFSAHPHQVKGTASMLSSTLSIPLFLAALTLSLSLYRGVNTCFVFSKT